MANEKQNARDEKAGRKSADKAAAAEPARYSSAEHIKSASAMYGVPGHFVAGAISLAEKDGEAKDAYTKDEVESAIAAFRRHDLTKEN